MPTTVASQERPATFAEYARLLAARADAVRTNASRRMRGLAPIPVPPKPLPALGMFAYGPDGSYWGRIFHEDECPDGCISDKA